MKPKVKSILFLLFLGTAFFIGVANLYRSYDSAEIPIVVFYAVFTLLCLLKIIHAASKFKVKNQEPK